MAEPVTLRIFLDPPMLETAREGTFNFMNKLREAVEQIGWQVAFRPEAEAATSATLPGYALVHMMQPPHDRALTFRRAYHYPFWNIEPVPQRWRFHVATTPFDPAIVPRDEAQDFLDRITTRVLPGPAPTRGEIVLIPLQGCIRVGRSFQTMSPIEMVETVARTGRPTVATLHPNEIYDDADHAALAALAARHPNLTIGGNTAALLRDCAFVATQNSSVAFDGLMLGKPAVLFGQSDFHHIALSVAELGADQALALAPDHRPDFTGYIWWFLRHMSVNATAQDAHAQIRAAMKRGGWPIDQPPQ